MKIFGVLYLPNNDQTPLHYYLVFIIFLNALIWLFNQNRPIYRSTRPYRHQKFEYEFALVFEKQPIRTLYPKYRVFWLDEFGVWVPDKHVQSSNTVKAGLMVIKFVFDCNFHTRSLKSQHCSYWMWCSNWLFFEYECKTRARMFYNRTTLSA